MTRLGLRLALIVAVAACALADDAPAWLRDAAKQAIPSYDSKVPAVMLLRETRVQVEDSGRAITTTRRAVRVLTQEGRNDARGLQIYITGASKLRELRGWVITPSGRVLKLSPDDINDKPNPNDLYNEVRERSIQAGSKADAGSIFGYESITEDRTVFTQVENSLQDRLPTLLARFSVSTPSGWRVEHATYNAPELKPSIQGSTYTWEMRELPFIEPETLGPTLLSLAPRVAVGYYPPAAKPEAMRTFASWKEVSVWLSELADPQAEPTPEITAKAQELAGKANNEFQKIAQIGRFVQGIKYTSIQTGVGRGGGYRPHSAGDIFVKLYGDCKDKVTLMRAMLKAVGISSYLVSVYSSDRSYVQENFPSPQHFNHAIIAVKVSSETRPYTVVDHPALSRLMFFDPTSAWQPGTLPLSEQGSLGLVNAGENGALVRLPLQPPMNPPEQRVEAVLTADGKLSATSLNGRPWQNSYPNGELKNNRLLIFRPPAPGSRSTPYLTSATRKYPVLLNPAAARGTVKVKLPPEFKVDEIPDPVMLESPFGSYSATCSADSGELTCTRQLQIRHYTVPAVEYASVRDFFQKIERSEASAVVLERR